MDKLKELFAKYRELILYVFFGGLTTLVNIISYWIFAHPLGMGITVSTVIAWLLSVVFAYLTNRKWVFQSKASGSKAIAYEVSTFFGGRLFSGLLDIGIMYLFVTVLFFNDLLIKILSNILVILLNYIISKLVVFRKRKQAE